VDEEGIGPLSHRLGLKVVPFSSALSSDGSRLIWRFNKLRVFDTNSGKEVASFDDDSHSYYRGLKTNSGSEWLVVVGLYEKQTRLYDLHQRLFFGNVELEHPTTGDAAISIDGRCFAIGTHRPDAKIYIFETATLRKRLTIPLEHGFPQRLAISPDARFLAAAASDGTVLAWELR
jgi:WD40 repeat protein